MLDYMVNDNGVDRSPTTEEIAEMQRLIAEYGDQVQPEPTPEERIAILESALLELGAMLGGG